MSVTRQRSCLASRLATATSYSAVSTISHDFDNTSLNRVPKEEDVLDDRLTAKLEIASISIVRRVA